MAQVPTEDVREIDGQLYFHDKIIRYKPDALPKELSKYYAQRYRLFSRYDEGCCLDRESWYSVTPESLAVQIAQVCASHGARVIIDLFCGAGGNAIAFAAAEEIDMVVAVDSCPVKLACAKQNAAIYGVADKITFIEGDWALMLHVVMQSLADQIDTQPLVFLSPPWGGPQYNVQRTFDIESMPIPASVLMQVCGKYTQRIVLYLPRQSRQDQVAALVSASTLSLQSSSRPFKCACLSLHYLTTSGACKALVCYFGSPHHTEHCQYNKQV
ncbi:RNA cap guanine-N2 methyltransferase-domain-containing protein [Protomyces lactucae-debilis]|uniref:Trimethylguanosine synthase n=1 Tax=Protomyces lactucae-debilis TaxID=2754530 RepID=A0A1Y2F105_PROLT|nr:RNA cap guanine-N2 methyltransferase-domain-containing protein [Protomyces lactucae-debilis]ORY77387.1 RNA cap guanine-N2 methyltransferase-domain-containing protein [Protomyces lactucae-debilis]